MAGGAAIRILALALTLCLLGVEAPVLHLHHGASPAFYDEECPLSRLAATETRVGVSPVFALVQPVVVAPLAAGPIAIGGPAAPVLPAAARAPPIAA
jgi:hypothetical protein